MKKWMGVLPMFYLMWHLASFNSYDEWFKYFNATIAPKKNIKSVDVKVRPDSERVMVIWSEEVGD